MRRVDAAGLDPRLSRFFIPWLLFVTPLHGFTPIVLKEQDLR
jgi:hypothetical protein